MNRMNPKVDAYLSKAKKQQEELETYEDHIPNEQPKRCR